MNIDKNRIAQLILLRLSNKANNIEQDELKEILDSHPNLETIYKEFSSNEQTHSKYKNYTSFDSVASWSKIEKAIEQKRDAKIKYRRKISLSIASIAAAVIAVTLLIYTQQPTKIEDNLITPIAEVTSTGTTIDRPLIITNSGAEITIDNYYGDDKRTKEAVDLTAITTNSNISTQSSNTIAEAKYNKFVNPAKYSSKIKLEDGTIVHLNGNSTLTFPEHFSGEERRVELKGEGFFEVVKSNKKFVVASNGVDVCVYGTKFNIDATQNDIVRTVLIEGSVGVIIGDKEVKLQPNDLCEADIVSGEVETRQVDVAKYTAWTRGMFIFEKDSIETLLTQLSQWYNVEFIIENEALKDISVTTIFARDADLSEIIKSLKMLDIEVEYEEAERRYMVK